MKNNDINNKSLFEIFLFKWLSLFPNWGQWVNTLRQRQDGHHFTDKCIFLHENIWILIEISLKFVSKGPINNIPALVQIMAWRRPSDKPLSEPTVVNLLTHIHVTQPQWGKTAMMHTVLKTFCTVWFVHIFCMLFTGCILFVTEICEGKTLLHCPKSGTRLKVFSNQTQVSVLFPQWLKLKLSLTWSEKSPTPHTPHPFSTYYHCTCPGVNLIG